ncbi:TonB-dependent receptor [Aliikangiella marina]|uniref:TonB-dependent receptor n=1 Tax=Aliikangiella marina TaxID=1712262 RepID=A0A545TJU9_9GAMM|nr:TonB-dependent receptor [Aliikangiella marina]TQV77502.1 TonB-dependent receptor [Aliikangiella marina]
MTELLDLSLADLLKVQVSTASKSTQSISDAPSIINVITEAEITDLGLDTLSDALSLIPGISPIQQLKSDRVLVVRGLALKDGVLILIDGVPVNDAFDGGFDFYQRPLDDIKKIEVVRGPGSALYGSYAVSGVIQLFTKQYESDSLSAQLSGGSFAEKSLNVNYSQQLSLSEAKGHVTASFNYFDNEGDDLFIAQDLIFSPELGTFLPPLANPTLTPTFRQETTEKFNGHFNVNIENFRLGFVRSQIITNPLVSHLGIVTAENATIKDSVQDSIMLQYESKLLKKVSLTSKLFYVLNKSKLFGQSQPPQYRGDEDQDGLNENFPSGIIENFFHQTHSTGLSFDLEWNASDDHQLLFGLEFEDTHLDDVEKVANVSLAGRGPTEIFPAQDMTFEFMPEGVKRDSKSIYVQDRWNLSDKTTVTTGLRYGDYSDFGDTTNPRLAVVHQFNSKIYTKFLYGEAFKAPAFSQLFDATPTLSANRVRGNSSLLPTEIKTLEWQIGYNFSESLISTATLYRNETENEIFFNSTPGIQQWQNSGERESQGIELELQGKFLSFDYATVNYSYQDTTGVDQGAGANIHSPHRFNFFANQKLNNHLKLGVTLAHYASPTRERNDNRERLKAKTLVGLNLQYQNNSNSNWQFELSVKNLLDEDGRDEIESSIGLLDDIPIEGRKFQFTLKYDLR